MTEFNRGLTPKYMAKLDGLATAVGENWWKDLLNTWAPAGTPLTESRRLRIAIRRNYINFYHKGQSVAKVEFGADGEPRVKTHLKYVLGKETFNGQAYATISGSAINLGKSRENQVLEYQGATSLSDWIIATEYHTGSEKRGVEAIVGKNGNVIDLEMGLPSWEGQDKYASKTNGGKFAPRMDMVALEETNGNLAIVFWEAKTIRDGRLRSESKPEVLRQLSAYQNYLSDSHRCKTVVDAYQVACAQLVKLHGMMAQVAGANPVPELDKVIELASGGSNRLVVDCSPRLAIFHGENETVPKSWDEKHRTKLEDYKIKYRENPADIILDRHP